MDFGNIEKRNCRKQFSLEEVFCIDFVWKGEKCLHKRFNFIPVRCVVEALEVAKEKKFQGFLCTINESVDYRIRDRENVSWPH